MKNLWQKFKKPIIGLAPMDGYTDSAFRQICKLVNPEIILYTEFCSTDGLVFNKNKVSEKLRFVPREKPIIAQIFGKKVESFVKAAKFCEELGFDGIDLNMGCPAKKVVKSEHGIALRKKPVLAFDLIEAVAKATTLPVSVKTRLGWADASDLLEFGLGAQNAGADMICVHGRTFTQPYKVEANFAPIYELKKALKIPVLGNGGITSIADGMAKIKQSSLSGVEVSGLEKLTLDGFLIGQASFGNPWIFAQNQPKSFQEKVPLIKEHAKLLIEAKGERIACQEIRKHLAKYIKGFEKAKELRNKFVNVKSLDEINLLLDDLLNRTF